MNGIAKYVREIIAVVILITSVAGSYFVMKSTVNYQGLRIDKLECSTIGYPDRLARLETKVDLMLNILQANKKIK